MFDSKESFSDDIFIDDTKDKATKDPTKIVDT